MPATSYLTPAANNLLVTIYNCCAREIGRVNEFHNNGGAKTVQIRRTFDPVPISRIILEHGFNPTIPSSEALQQLLEAFTLLWKKTCIKIEGQGWRNRYRKTNTLLRLQNAIKSFGDADRGGDEHLEDRFSTFLAEQHRELADAKVSITNRGAIYSLKKHYARVSRSRLPPPGGSIA